MDKIFVEKNMNIPMWVSITQNLAEKGRVIQSELMKESILKLTC